MELIYGIKKIVYAKTIKQQWILFFNPDIMDARSFANKTKKLTKSEKNNIIGKKCSNVASYKPSPKSMPSASSANQTQNLTTSNDN